MTKNRRNLLCQQLNYFPVIKLLESFEASEKVAWSFMQTWFFHTALISKVYRCMGSLFLFSLKHLMKQYLGELLLFPPRENSLQDMVRNSTYELLEKIEVFQTTYERNTLSIK